MAIDLITVLTNAVPGILIVGVVQGWSAIKKSGQTDSRLKKVEDSLLEQDKVLDKVVETLAHITTDVAILKTALIGMDGNNGIRGDLKRLTDRVAALENK